MAITSIRKYNELKALVLDHLKNNAAIPAAGIAASLGVERHNVANCLLRLKRAYLVKRAKVEGGPRGRRVYEYEITQKGLGRLDFYEEASK